MKNILNIELPIIHINLNEMKQNNNFVLFLKYAKFQYFN